MAEQKKEESESNLEEIIRAMKGNGLTELEYSQNGKKFSVKYSETKKIVQHAKPQEKTAEQSQAQQIEKPKITGSYIVHSPYVGYCHINVVEEGSGEQEAVGKPQPFVKVGDKVSLEDVLCVIFALKVPNELKLKRYKDFPAEQGIIEEIFVEHEQPVDYGKPLMKIQPCFK